MQRNFFKAASLLEFSSSASSGNGNKNQNSNNESSSSSAYVNSMAQFKRSVSHGQRQQINGGTYVRPVAWTLKSEQRIPFATYCLAGSSSCTTRGGFIRSYWSFLATGETTGRATYLGSRSSSSAHGGLDGERSFADIPCDCGKIFTSFQNCIVHRTNGECKVTFLGFLHPVSETLFKCNTTAPSYFQMAHHQNMLKRLSFFKHHQDLLPVADHRNCYRDTVNNAKSKTTSIVSYAQVTARVAEKQAAAPNNNSTSTSRHNNTNSSSSSNDNNETSSLVQLADNDVTFDDGYRLCAANIEDVDKANMNERAVDIAMLVDQGFYTLVELDRSLSRFVKISVLKNVVTGKKVLNQMEVSSFFGSESNTFSYTNRKTMINNIFRSDMNFQSELFKKLFKQLDEDEKAAKNELLLPEVSRTKIEAEVRRKLVQEAQENNNNNNKKKLNINEQIKRKTYKMLQKEYLPCCDLTYYCGGCVELFNKCDIKEAQANNNKNNKNISDEQMKTKLDKILLAKKDAATRITYYCGGCTELFNKCDIKEEELGCNMSKQKQEFKRNASMFKRTDLLLHIADDHLHRMIRCSKCYKFLSRNEAANHDCFFRNATEAKITDSVIASLNIQVFIDSSIYLEAVFTPTSRPLIPDIRLAIAEKIIREKVTTEKVQVAPEKKVREKVATKMMDVQQDELQAARIFDYNEIDEVDGGLISGEGELICTSDFSEFSRSLTELRTSSSLVIGLANWKRFSTNQLIVSINLERRRSVTSLNELVVEPLLVNNNVDVLLSLEGNGIADRRLSSYNEVDRSPNRRAIGDINCICGGVKADYLRSSADKFEYIPLRGYSYNKVDFVKFLVRERVAPHRQGTVGCFYFPPKVPHAGGKTQALAEFVASCDFVGGSIYASHGLWERENMRVSNHGFRGVSFVNELRRLLPDDFTIVTPPLNANNRRTTMIGWDAVNDIFIRRKSGVFSCAANHSLAVYTQGMIDMKLDHRIQYVGLNFKENEAYTVAAEKNERDQELRAAADAAADAAVVAGVEAEKTKK